MKPNCHNRAEFTDPNAGWQETGRKAWAVYRYGLGIPSVMPVLRYRHPWFTDRCTVHDKADIGPNQTYAQFHGWSEHCQTCRHFPRDTTCEAP